MGIRRHRHCYLCICHIDKIFRRNRNCSFEPHLDDLGHLGTGYLYIVSWTYCQRRHSSHGRLRKQEFVFRHHDVCHDIRILELIGIAESYFSGLGLCRHCYLDLIACV